MSTKTTTHHTRRAPLSLSGGGKQQSQNHYSGKSTDSNGNSNNSASAKNDNKHSASQKTESNVNDAKESTPKDMKKPQNTEKKQLLTNETVKKNEKTDEKKTQNGNGKSAANGGNKEKHQNGSDKQDPNGSSNGTNAKTSTTSSNGNSNAKSNTKSTEKAATPAAKEETKSKEQKPAEPLEKSEKVSLKESEKEKEKDKKKANEQENIVEKEARSLRQETAAAAEPEKKQLDKHEPPKSEDTKMEVVTPTSRSSAGQAKSRTTPTTGVEKSGRNTPTRPVEKTSASPRNKIVTTVIDDVEMEPLAMESSPAKSKENTVPVAVAGTVLQPPAATSTPGKAPMATQKTKTHTVDAKSDQAINAPNSGNSPDRKSVPRTITHIGGRRSIRPLTEYTPSKFQSNLQFRESYRRINTELDVSSTTNTSMNVTVGSEIPNNSSFSFFGRGRKRDRTPPPQSQSTMELQTDADYSPPKRARLDMYTLFSVVSSPLTMLRSRFSRASIQSSTPVKLTSKLAAAGEDKADVQNVSGISIEEENASDAADSDEKTATEDVAVSKNTDEDTTPKMDSPMKVDEKCGMEKGDEVSDELDTLKPSNVNEVEAGIADTSVSSAKNKRCNIM